MPVCVKSVKLGTHYIMSVGVNLATVPSLIQLSGGVAVILKMATRDLEGTVETRI